jgi:hypothetical protein
MPAQTFCFGQVPWSSYRQKNTVAGVDNVALTFSWVQLQPGTDLVTLNNANTATPSFIVPLQGTIGIVICTFEVTITHSSGTVSKDSVDVKSDTSVKDNIVIDSYSRVNSQGGTITVTAHSDLVGDPSAQMLISANGGGFTAMTKVGTNTGKWTFSQRSTPAGLPIVVKTRIGTTEFGTARVTAHLDNLWSLLLNYQGRLK